MIVNEKGYLACKNSKRNWWLVKDPPVIDANKIRLDPFLIGKRVRFKIEVID